MSRRGYEEYERYVGDRRSLDPRNAQREQDPREHMAAELTNTSRRRMDDRNPSGSEDTMDSRSDRTLDSRSDRTFDSRSDRTLSSRSSQWSELDSASRPPYSYTDKNDRDDLPFRGYMDGSQDRRRPPIDLRTQRREEASSRIQDYFLPGEGINRAVIQHEICRYLGNDATVRPYTHPDGREGYLIKARRALTTAMITTLKQDSQRFELEAGKRFLQSGLSGVAFASSATSEDRQRQGRPDVPRAIHGVDDMDVDEYVDARRAVRSYRDAEPLVDTRSGMYTRRAPPQISEETMGPRQPLSISRSGEIPSGSQGYSPPSSYPASSQETFEGSKRSYGAGYPAFTSGAHFALPTTTSGAVSAYVDPTTGRLNVGDQAGAGHPGWGDTPNFRERGPGV